MAAVLYTQFYTGFLVWGGRLFCVSVKCGIWGQNFFFFLYVMRFVASLFYFLGEWNPSFPLHPACTGAVLYTRIHVAVLSTHMYM